jgi:hypothetical protein
MHQGFRWIFESQGFCKILPLLFHPCFFRVSSVAYKPLVAATPLCGLFGLTSPKACILPAESEIALRKSGSALDEAIFLAEH